MSGSDESGGRRIVWDGGERAGDAGNAPDRCTCREPAPGIISLYSELCPVHGHPEAREDLRALAEEAARRAPPADDDFPGATGGFRASQRKTLDELAAAAIGRDVARVQRLALMTLTWWNGKSTPLPRPDERATYDWIAARIPRPTESPAAKEVIGPLARPLALLRRLRAHLRGPA